MSIHYIIKSNIQLIILVAIFGALAACNVEDTKEEASTTTLSFSGSVGDGPITQAQISVTDANGTVVAKTVSDITANYSVSISGDISYPLLVTATGGTDVVTSAKPDFVLLSVAMNSTLKTININPFSTLIVKTAQAMHGGLTPLNLSVANKYILEKLNFGLDPTLVPNPITTTIDAANVAVVIKASEALGETIRRIRSALLIGGMDLTEDQIIDIIAEDMIDSVLDGRGPSDNIRIAATAHIVSAQVLVEALANQLYVSGADATTRMNTAINLSMPSANTTTADVLITEGMLTQTRLAVAATQALNSSSNLVAVAIALAGLPGNSLAADINTILPESSSDAFNEVIEQLPMSTDLQLESVNAIVRTDGISGGDNSDGNTGGAVGSNSGSGDTVVRINAGGANYVDTTGNLWLADTHFNTGSAFSVTDAIAGTDEDSLFQSERWDSIDGEELEYNVAVPNGDYTVNLYFADRYQASGLRVFSISIENQLVHSGLDIFSEVGSNTALLKSNQVSVNDGQLDIRFLHDVENPKISAIEIVGQNATAAEILTPDSVPAIEPFPLPDSSSGAAPTVAVSYTPSNEIFPNPERGFHENVNIVTERNFSAYSSQGFTLVRSYVRLDDYRNSSLPQSLITDLEAGLAALRDYGLKVILRFSYNFGYEPDAPKSWILQHISELKPTLLKYSDVIAVMQAGFIGAWGEWHSSTNGLANPTDEKEILEALLSALPASRMVQVRTPNQKLNLYPKLSTQMAFDSSYASRVGHVNDCFLANDHDAGTYLPGDFGYTYEQWKNYLNVETNYVMMGGETCAMNQNSREDEALVEMERLHYSYLNKDYYAPMISYWQQTGDYTVMQRKMGYRFILDNADVPTQIRPGGHFDLRIALRNEGWAGLYNPRPVIMVLDDGTNRFEVQLDQVDPRFWTTRENIVFQARLELPSTIPEGNYQLSLWLPDDAQLLRSHPAYSIRFANQNIWDTENGYNVLGNVLVQDNAPGTRNNSATNFTASPL